MAQTIEHKEESEWKGVLKRGLAMLLFTIAFAIAETLLAILTLLQFVWLLVTGATNRFIYEFGRSLAKWTSDVVLFQTCVSDKKPFPWTTWPSAREDDGQTDLFTDQDGI